MELTAEAANVLRYEDDFEADGQAVAVVDRRQIDQGRWESYHCAVVTLSGIDGFWAFEYAEGLTENQENIPFEDDVELYEVFPREVTTVVYDAKKVVE